MDICMNDITDLTMVHTTGEIDQDYSPDNRGFYIACNNGYLYNDAQMRNNEHIIINEDGIGISAFWETEQAAWVFYQNWKKVNPL